MKYLRPILWGSLIFLAGCLPSVSSVHPLYTEEDVVFDERLLGTWMDSEDPENTLVISQAQAAGYVVTVDKDTYSAKLTRLGDRLFIDCTNDQSGKEDLELAVHAFYKIEFSADQLLLYHLDDDIMKTSGEFSYTEVDQGLLLTDSTSVLRQLFQKSASETLFSRPSRFIRK